MPDHYYTASPESAHEARSFRMVFAGQFEGVLLETFFRLVDADHLEELDGTFRGSPIPK